MVNLNTQHEKLSKQKLREKTGGNKEWGLRDAGQHLKASRLRLEPRGKGKKGGAEKTLEEILAENFPNLTDTINPEIQTGKKQGKLWYSHFTVRNL